jgi:hypothetical protein
MPLVSIERIAIDPDYCGGKPRIAGTRIPVATIAQLYLEMGEIKDTRAAFAAPRVIASRIRSIFSSSLCSYGILLSWIFVTSESKFNAIVQKGSSLCPLSFK